MNYDPDLILNEKRVKQQVKLTFGVWKFRKTVEVSVGGNCCGLSVIDCAVEVAFDRLKTDTDGCKEIWLFREDGKKILCKNTDYDDHKDSDFLKNILIAAEIIDVKEQSMKEKPAEARNEEVNVCETCVCRRCLKNILVDSLKGRCGSCSLCSRNRRKVNTECVNRIEKEAE